MRSPSRSTLGLALALLAVPAAAVAGDPAPADLAERGDRAGVRALLDRRVDPNRAQVDGMTALHWAAIRDDLDLARDLVAAGADARAANRYGVVPLSLACSNGSGPMVELLLAAGADPAARLAGGETPLMVAARAGVLGPVRVLLARGVDPDARERHGQTALMWAAAEGHTAVVEELLKAGANFRLALPSGFSPLFFAVREGRVDATLALLRAGADVNATIEPKRAVAKGPTRGMSPLILAVENGHFDLATALLDAGADPNDQRSGFTALHTLTWVRKPNRGDDDSGDPAPIGSGAMTSLQFAQRLLEHGADPNARLARGASGRGVLNRTGATPTLLAAMTADVPLLRLLREHGADLLRPNADGATPLMAAAGLGTLAPGEEAGTEDEAIEAVRLLLAWGADVNTVDANGETAMHGAAYKSLPRVVHLLAERGASVTTWNRPNKYGWTPIAIAEGHRPGNFKPSPETLGALRQILDEPSSSRPPLRLDDRK